MADNFLFIGEPGPYARDYLQVLDKLGVVAKRLPVDASPDEVARIAPLAIVLSIPPEVMGRFVVPLRERRELADVPVVARLPYVDPVLAASAYRGGCNDLLVDGRFNQFKALVSVITNQESFDAMRAPAGLVVLGHPDRTIRMRIGQVLRRAGYDLHFVSSQTELSDAVIKVNPRAVIASQEVWGTLLTQSDDQSDVPRIVICDEAAFNALQGRFSEEAPVRLWDEQSDAQSLTFVLNDLLMPQQKSERRTPRILYGTTVAFRPENASRDEEFYGFTFNVNIGGLFIRTLTPPPLQSRLLVKFSPPYGRGLVAMNAQVVWLKTLESKGGAGAPEGVGVQFIDSPLADTVGFEAGYNHLRAQQDRRTHSYTSNAPNVPQVNNSMGP